MKKSYSDECPVSLSETNIIQMGHGGGGKMMRTLIEGVFVKDFSNPFLRQMADSAVIHVEHKRLAYTTDSYVVSPLFFPGGDIGTVAVNGTVNDLSMAGAQPLFLSAGFILEEGLPIETLIKIVHSMRRAALNAGVEIVAGDTKVVERGKGDGIYINTSGIGVIDHKLDISPESIEPEDAIILSGDIGRHGIAVMAAREGLSFETKIESDCTSLAKVVRELIESKIEVHCMRDLTRGGLGSALVEIAETGEKEICVEENLIPVCDPVRAACEILGIDPIYIANEGRFVCFVPQPEADKTLQIIQRYSFGKKACIIGEAGIGNSGLATMKSLFGTEKIISMLSGEQLPRIC